MNQDKFKNIHYFNAFTVTMHICILCIIMFAYYVLCYVLRSIHASMYLKKRGNVTTM